MLQAHRLGSLPATNTKCSGSPQVKCRESLRWDAANALNASWHRCQLIGTLQRAGGPGARTVMRSRVGATKLCPDN